MNKYGDLKCAKCGSGELRLDVYNYGYDAEFEHSNDKEGFNTWVSLICKKCQRVHPICRVRDNGDVKDAKDLDGGHNEG